MFSTNRFGLDDYQNTLLDLVNNYYYSLFKKQYSVDIIFKDLFFLTGFYDRNKDIIYVSLEHSGVDLDTLLHELGHYVAHKELDYLNLESFDNDSSLKASLEILDEAFAFYFNYDGLNYLNKFLVDDELKEFVKNGKLEFLRMVRFYVFEQNKDISKGFRDVKYYTSNIFLYATRLFLEWYEHNYSIKELIEELKSLQI